MKRIFHVLLLITIFIVGCSSGEEVKDKPIIKGKTLEEMISNIDRNIFLILHKEEVQNGVLIFYIPDIKGDAGVESESKLGVEYLRKTPRGWEMSYKGGVYSSGINKAIHYEFLPDDKDENTPLPMFYGEIKEPDIKQVLVVDLKDGMEKQAKIVSIDKKPGMTSGMNIWYVLVDASQGPNFKIKGISKDRKVKFTEKVDVKLQSTGTIKPFQEDIKSQVKEWLKSQGKSEEKGTNNIASQLLQTKYLKAPEKIIVYKKGEQKIIGNEDNLYNKIIELVDNRIKEPLEIAQLAVLKGNEKRITENEIALEFIYSQKQFSEFKHLSENKPIKKEYFRLLMPLTGVDNDLLFFGNNEQYYSGPLGILQSPNNLLKLLNQNTF